MLSPLSPSSFSFLENANDDIGNLISLRRAQFGAIGSHEDDDISACVAKRPWGDGVHFDWHDTAKTVQSSRAIVHPIGAEQTELMRTAVIVY